MRPNDRSIARSLCVALCALAFTFVSPAARAAEAAPSPLIEPVFPAENANLVFVEGEDAVSTNFAREPTLNYGTSGFRALQLNRMTGLEGVGSFYADFVFTVPSAGSWELWYGGTPPGPRDDLYPSYSSPFLLTIDAQKPVPVSREAVTVVENYSPSFYWNLVGDFSLTASSHKVRFEVTEKRRIDGRYYLYFDCFFLVKKENGARLLAEPAPPVFPRDMEERRINAPFPSIDDSLIRIRDNPGKTEPLVELSLLYTLLGDYLNALKYLNRAALLQPKDPAIALLVAKNRIWKGDIAEGLKAYRSLLQADPKRRHLWLEAGKVAAWTGRYDDSIAFFRDGLAVFPRDTDLTINLGLTYVWASKGQEAETVFREAQGLASSDSGKLKEMGRVYRVNGYPDRAVRLFTAAAAAAPQDLEAHLLLIETLLAMGKKAEAEAAQARIASTFAPSVRLTAYLDGFREKEGLKEAVMEEYRAKLVENPDNLVLRQVLAQTYFWNSLKARAIEEYRHILDNHAYLSIRDMENSSSSLLWLIDSGSLVSDWFSRVPSLAQQQRSALSAQAQKLSQAQAARDAAQKTLDSARAAQAAAKPGKEADAALDAVHAAEDKLLAAGAAVGDEEAALSARVAEARALLARFADLKLTTESNGGRLGDLQQKDAAAQDAFVQATKGSGWKFDRAGTLSELAADLKDNALAKLVTAKIYMMDGQTSPVQSILTGVAPGVGARYTLVQSFLWAGKVKEASSLIGELSDAPGPAILPSYFKDLSELARSLASEAPAGGAPAPADPGSDAKAAALDLANLDRDASAVKERISRDLTLMRTFYRRAMTRAFFSFETNVSSIRNELGDYDLAGEPPALDAAIFQFTRVLAVDPGDLSATFRLGKVYQWKRDWKRALDSFKAVYSADPYYENVASLYNQVEREHAGSLSSLAYYLAEPQRVQWHAEASYARAFDSTVGLAASYQVDDMRGARADGTGLTDHSAFQVHDISLGVPIQFFEANASITPWIGGIGEANGLFSRTDSTGAAVSSDDRIGIYTAEPYARLDATVGGGDALFLNATLRWGRQPETWDLLRTAVYDASAEANLVTLLSFIDAWPFRDTSLRTYGRVDLLHTAVFTFENLLYTALQEITINILKGGTPYGVLSIGGNVIYQNSAKPEGYLYYAPIEVLTAGGSLTGSLWIGVGDGNVLGLSLRAYAGTFQVGILGASPTRRIKGEAEADVSFSQGDGTFTLTVIGNATYNPALGNPWDYWSAFVRLGYTTKLPRLLAP